MAEQYGYWISHKGELIPVNKFKHYDLADQYVLKHHYKEYLDYVTQEDDDRYDPPSSASFLFDRLGWIRIVQEGHILNAEISPNSLTLSAYRAFVKFVNDNLFEYYNIDVKEKHNIHIKGYNYSEDVQGKRYKDKMFTMLKGNVDSNKVIGGVMAKASLVRIMVHASVRANEARERLELYKRLKNDKKI